MVFLARIARTNACSSKHNGNNSPYLSRLLGRPSTFEYTNDAFGNKDGAAAFVASDAIFMAIVGGMTFLGARGLIGNGDPAEWAKGIVTNDWYNDLLDFEAGWALILGTWSVLASIVFYFYWGIAHMAWIDPGVYSIAIALMGTGLVLRMLSSVEDEE